MGKIGRMPPYSYLPVLPALPILPILSYNSPVSGVA